MFVNDLKLVFAAKSKVEQDEWLNAIMKGLSQGVNIHKREKLIQIFVHVLAFGDER